MQHELQGFTDEDKKKVVEFLNMVAKYAEFKLNTEQLISYFKLLAHMQSTILPKIDANILEVKRVVEPKDDVDQEVTEQDV